MVMTAQNVGIGTATPTQKLEVAGAVKIGGTETAAPGTIRWNAASHDFEGFNGKAWVSLTGGKTLWGNQATYAHENDAANHNGNAGSVLGSAVALGGGLVFTGAPGEHSSNGEKQASGRVLIYHKRPDGWFFYHSLLAPDAASGDRFGSSLDVSSTHLIAGAPNADAGNKEDMGKAYIYTIGNGSFPLEATLTPSDGTTDSYFGETVALSGNLAIVGMPLKEIGLYPHIRHNQGAVYPFRREGSTWVPLPWITPAEGKAGEQFGSSLSADGSFVAVGAPQAAHDGLNGTGKVYLYQNNGSGLVPHSLLINPDLELGDEFGYSLHLAHDTLVVGAPEYSYGEHDSTGKAFVFVRSGNAWNLKAILRASDGRRTDAFGSSVHRFGSWIIVGAPRAKVGSALAQGKAYIFRQSGNAWVQEAVLTLQEGTRSARLGTQVAIGPGIAVAGAPEVPVGGKFSHGNLYFFEH